MKLMLVDSNLAFAQYLRSELLRGGAMLCDVESANSFADAARQLGAEHFDAILVDPTSLTDAPASLYDDLQQLAPRAPILVLAEELDEAAAIDAVRQGAHDCLSKNRTPPDWLLRRVRIAMERQRGATTRAKLVGQQVAQRGSANDSPFTRASDPPASFASSEFREVESTDATGSAVACLAARQIDDDSPPGRHHAAGWHVLQVENDPVFLTFSQQLLCAGAHPLQVTRASHLADAEAQLKSASFDAVLLDLSLSDSKGLDTLVAILGLAGNAPVVVTTAGDEATTAIEGIRRGAEDFLNKAEPDLRYLRRALQLAIVRRDRALRMPPSPAVEQSPASRAAAAAAERRRHARYLLAKPIFVTPVLPDGSPAATYSADGFSVDVSEGGLRFEIGDLQRLPTTHLLVGIEGLDTVLYFATVEARHVVSKGNGLDVGAQFAHGPRDLIRRANLEPTFNPATARYETGLPLDVIMKWVDFGVFRPALFDRTFVCPQCRAIPTFRNGCRVCGSVRLHSRPLIHHFACAHVGYVSDFEQGGVIVCPKCRTRNLIVGADFEHLNGPYHCLDCDWSDTELDTVGQCMKCELRFPMTQAIEEDLIGYHVNRLDPLAFINAG